MNQDNTDRVIAGIGCLILACGVCCCGPVSEPMMPDPVMPVSDMTIPLCMPDQVTCSQTSDGGWEGNPFTCVPSLCYCPQVEGARCCCPSSRDMWIK